MSVTALGIFGITMDLLDERLSSGTIDEDSTADYKARALGILTTLQSELLRYSDYYKTFEFDQTVIAPNVGRTERINHDVVDVEVESDGVAYAYFFQCDGPATVYVEELQGGSWSILETIAVSDSSKLVNFKGLITPTVGATSTRLRFTGDYFYTLTNVALYDKRFSTLEKVPNYEPFIEIDMPDDFKSVSDLIKEEFPSKYIKAVNYYWEGKDKLFLSRDFEGTIRIIYRPTPPDVTDINQELVLDDVTAISCLPYGLGAKLMATENVSLGSYLQSKYEENKYEATRSTPTQDNDVEDVYDVTLGYRRC